MCGCSVPRVSPLALDLLPPLVLSLPDVTNDEGEEVEINVTEKAAFQIRQFQVSSQNIVWHGGFGLSPNTS